MKPCSLWLWIFFCQYNVLVTSVYLRSMNTGQEEMPGEFDLRKFARPSPWMTCTDLNERIQPSGAVLSDDELIRQRDPHYWERDDPRDDKELGFWSTDMRSLERLYGKVFLPCAQCK